MNKARAARAIHLDDNMTVPAAMHCVVTECVRQLQENMLGIVSNDDIDYVHQARVALRRLRSADKAFSTVCTSDDWHALMQEAQWLANLLGKLRDLQILITVTLPSITKAHTGAIDFAPLKKELIRRSERAHAKLFTALRSKRYRMLLQALQSWLDDKHGTQRKNLSSFAQKALSKRWCKVDTLAARWEKLDQTQHHTLRKRAKKLRYAIEFFASLYPSKAVKKYIKYLETIQKALGNLNDTATTQALLRPLLRHTDTASAARTALEWLSSVEQNQLDSAATVLAPWRRHRPFW